MAMRNTIPGKTNNGKAKSNQPGKARARTKATQTTTETIFNIKQG